MLTLVIGQGSRLALLGIALGLDGAFGLTRVLHANAKFLGALSHRIGDHTIDADGQQGGAP